MALTFAYDVGKMIVRESYIWIPNLLISNGNMKAERF
jgi:hypothetical protein